MKLFARAALNALEVFSLATMSANEPTTNPTSTSQSEKTKTPEMEKKSSSVVSLDFTYNEQWNRMKEILTDFVNLMCNIPVPPQGIRHFFEAIESLFREVAFIEKEFGDDTAKALFHRFGKDKDSAATCQAWRQHLESTIQRTRSNSAKELLIVLKDANIGSYLYEDVLPYFRKLANKRDGLMEQSAADTAGNQQFEGKQHLGFSIGQWTELEVVNTYRPYGQPIARYRKLTPQIEISML